MKINTDGVILGALSTFSSPASGHRVLDIGTGTGVIALMLTQRFSLACIDAVEIDKSAAQSAARNFSESPYADRLLVFLGDFSAFNSSHKYDLIVSNPPFFVNDLKNPEERKSIARHAGNDFFENLVYKCTELLTDNGLLWLILPVKQADLVVSLGCSHGLQLVKVINIHSDAGKPVIRKVICLRKVLLMEEALDLEKGLDTKEVFEDAASETFYIYETEKIYTQQYKQLLKDFFLAF